MGFKKLKKKTSKSFKKTTNNVSNTASQIIDDAKNKVNISPKEIINKISDVEKLGKNAQLIKVPALDSGRCPVYVKPIKKDCPNMPLDKSDVEGTFDVLTSKYNEAQKKLIECQNKSIPVNIVKDSIDSVFDEYNELHKKYKALEKQSKICQRSYNKKTLELKKISKKYVKDLRKCHLYLKRYYDDNYGINDQDEIYKEESMSLRNRITRTSLPIIIGSIVFIILLILCVLRLLKII